MKPSTELVLVALCCLGTVGLVLGGIAADFWMVRHGWACTWP